MEAPLFSYEVARRPDWRGWCAEWHRGDEHRIRVADRLRVPLALRAEEAFATYTGRTGEWWDPRYSANAETLEAVTIEPRVAGDPGCTMQFAHGSWKADNAEARSKFGDWPVMLDRFAALAETD